MCRQPHAPPCARRVVLGSAQREASGTQPARTEPASLPRGKVLPFWAGSSLFKQHSSPLSQSPHPPWTLSSDLGEPMKVPDTVTLPHVQQGTFNRISFLLSVLSPFIEGCYYSIRQNKLSESLLKVTALLSGRASTMTKVWAFAWFRSGRGSWPHAADMCHSPGSSFTKQISNRPRVLSGFSSPRNLHFNIHLRLNEQSNRRFNVLLLEASPVDVV